MPTHLKDWSNRIEDRRTKLHCDIADALNAALFHDCEYLAQIGWGSGDAQNHPLITCHKVNAPFLSFTFDS